MWDDFAVFWVAVVMRTKQNQSVSFVNLSIDQATKASTNPSPTMHDRRHLNKDEWKVGGQECRQARDEILAEEMDGIH